MPVRGNGEDSADRPELGPLRGGHHGLSPEQVAESQRERLLAALAEVVAARGYKQATITEIVKAASVSSRAFYQHFDSKEACFLAAFDAVEAHLHDLLRAAVAPTPDWPAAVVAALRAGLGFFGSEPDLARLCLVEPTLATPAIVARFREAVLAGVPFLAAGRHERPEAAALPDSTEDSLLGGLVVLASRQVLAGQPLPALLPDLVEFLLSPYLGEARARELAQSSSA